MEVNDISYNDITPYNLFKRMKNIRSGYEVNISSVRKIESTLEALKDNSVFKDLEERWNKELDSDELKSIIRDFEEFKIYVSNMNKEKIENGDYSDYYLRANELTNLLQMLISERGELEKQRENIIVNIFAIEYLVLDYIQKHDNLLQYIPNRLIEKSYVATGGQYIKKRMFDLEFKMKTAGLIPASKEAENDVDHVHDYICSIGVGAFVGDYTSINKIDEPLSFSELESKTNMENPLRRMATTQEGIRHIIDNIEYHTNDIRYDEYADKFKPKFHK